MSFVDRTKTVKDIEAYIHSGLEKFAKGNGFQLGIWADGELVGVIGLNYIFREFRCTEIGYWLGAKFEGRGVMTQGLSLSVPLPFCTS